MADTTNYGWPLPDKDGIQRAEIDKIAEALGLADAQVKALADLIAGMAFDKLAGVIADGQLPARVRAASSSIEDWNTAIENGWYMAAGADNAPDTSGQWFLGHVEVFRSVSPVYVTQTVHGFNGDSATNTRVWRRSCDAGVWGDWYRLRWSETEIQSMIDTATAGAINDLVNGAPGALDTLQELATALGDDPNFAATIAAQIGSKLPAASYTAADVLAKLLTVDGPSSGLSVTQAANANNALNATNATHAGTADAATTATYAGHATEAENSSKLNGQSASYYQRSLKDVTGVEVGQNAAGDRNVTIDLHADDTNIDRSFGIIRLAGEDGKTIIQQVGTGDIDIVGGGDFTRNGSTTWPININGTAAKVNSYVSGEQTITSAGTLTLAHGLGAVPGIVTAELVCKVAEFGYAVGTRLLWPPLMNNGLTGYSARMTSSEIVIRFGKNSAVFSAINITTGDWGNLTNANWCLVVRAYL